MNTLSADARPFCNSFTTLVRFFNGWNKLKSKRMNLKKSSELIDSTTNTSLAPTHNSKAAIVAPNVSETGEETNLNLSLLNINL